MRHDGALEADRAPLPELADRGIEIVRILYPDLHGVARGKNVPLGEFQHVADRGLPFCMAIMGTDLRHTPVAPRGAYPDLVARPDLSTLRVLPWEPGVVACLPDLYPPSDDAAAPPDPHGALGRVVDARQQIGPTPMVGPELEFYLCVPGDAYKDDAPGMPLPQSLYQALDAIEDDQRLRTLIGPETVDPFLAVKRFECERHRQWVSDWEIDEYLHHL